MGNVIMKAQQIVYGASNVEAALNNLDVAELIELNKRMAAIDDWKANVHEVTYTGPELTINNALAVPARSLKTTIEAIQDLHGLPFPYVGGAYKNKLPMTVSGIKSANTQGTWNGNAYTVNGVTYTLLTDNDDNIVGIKVNGTASTTAYLNIWGIKLAQDTYITSGATADINFRIGEATDASSSGANIGNDSGSGYTLNASTDYYYSINLYVYTGTTVNNVTVYPMLRKSTDSATFAPYSNICPIYGRTEVTITVEGESV